MELWHPYWKRHPRQSRWQTQLWSERFTWTSLTFAKGYCETHGQTFMFNIEWEMQKEWKMRKSSHWVLPVTCIICYVYLLPWKSNDISLLMTLYLVPCTWYLLDRYVSMLTVTYYLVPLYAIEVVAVKVVAAYQVSSITSLVRN